MSNLALGYTSDLRTPITHVGRVVQNARVDDHEYTSRKYTQEADSNTNQRVLNWDGQEVLGNGELMHVSRFSVLLKNKHDSFIANWNGDTDLRVFDCSNRMQSIIKMESELLKDEFSKLQAADARWRLAALTEMQKVEFGGIAATDGSQVGYDPRSMGGEPRELAAQFGGLTTIINTDVDPIHAGDCIVWYLPRQHLRGAEKNNYGTSTSSYQRKNGLPMGKQMIGVRSLQKELADPKFKAFCNGPIFAAENMLNTSTGDIAGLAPMAMEEYNMRCMFPYHKVIGRAMSGADSGKPFDILLGNYSA